MTKAAAIIVGLLASLPFSGGWAVDSTPRVQPRPNFVVILGEGQGWASMSVPMDDAAPEARSTLGRTPNLDALARQGMRFSDAYTSLPRCTPARAALFTGRNPAELHMTFIGEGRGDDSAGAYRRLAPPRCLLELPRDTVTIAEYLRGEGYATAHFGKWHVGRESPSSHGFDEHDGATSNGGPENVNEPNPKEAFGLTERGMAFMTRQVSAGKPFYLQMSHYAGRSEASARASTVESVKRRGGGWNEKEVGAAAVAEDIDATVGMVLKKIDDLGIAGRTYVIYTADHGCPGRNGPLTAGKGSLWEGGLRVPFLVRGPGVASGTVSHVRAVMTDIFPTLAGLAHTSAPLPAGIEGGSLADVLAHGGTGEVLRAHADLVFHYPHYDHGNEGPASAILLGDYKLIVAYENDAVHLFDVVKDPGERRDLARELPEKAVSLRQLLAGRLKEMNVQMAVQNPGYDPNAKPPANEGRGPRGGGRKAR